MRPHVLILEDNFLLAQDLSEIVQQELGGDAVAVATVVEALAKIPDHIDFAFLDVELSSGKSYPAARKLMQTHIPFIFVSGSERMSLPDDLRDIPFLSKPVPSGRLVRLTKAMSNVFD
ncbi:MAG: response regulator [Nitrospirales bacterium]